MSETVRQLRAIFSPDSIVVIGASRVPTKIGYEALKNVLVYSYKGKVCAVNPNATEILGVPCYPSVKDVPWTIDLAIIVVPAAEVPKVMEECGLKGVKGAVVISSGFMEVGESGKEIAEKLLSVARKYGIRFLCPNTMGFKNPVEGLDASFAFGMPYKGKIAIASQSGALSIGVIYLAAMEKIGLSKVIGMGNKLDICDADIIEYLDNDPSTSVIGLYIEGVKDGRKFFQAVKKCRKPIVVIKAGRSKEGAAAATTHTGSLAGSDIVYDGVFKQTNVIRVADVTELFDVSNALANQPCARGDRIGVISNGGGVGILLADGLVEHGMKVPDLSSATIEKLRKVLPPHVIPRNPVDLVADANFYRYEASMIAVLEDPGIDGAIVTCVHGGYARPGEYAGAMIKLVERLRRERAVKPVIGCWIGGNEISEVIEDLKDEDIPVYPSTTRAVEAMASLVNVGRWKRE